MKSRWSVRAISGIPRSNAWAAYSSIGTLLSGDRSVWRCASSGTSRAWPGARGPGVLSSIFVTTMNLARLRAAAFAGRTSERNGLRPKGRPADTGRSPARQPPPAGRARRRFAETSGIASPPPLASFAAPWPGCHRPPRQDCRDRSSPPLASFAAPCRWSSGPAATHAAQMLMGVARDQLVGPPPTSVTLDCPFGAARRPGIGLETAEDRPGRLPSSVGGRRYFDSFYPGWNMAKFREVRPSARDHPHLPAYLREGFQAAIELFGRMLGRGDRSNSGLVERDRR